MKTERILLLVVLVVLVITEVYLFSANRQKDAALVQWRESQEKVAQLQSALDQLKASSVATLNVENAKLRAENQSWAQKYPALQTENRQLREQNQKLSQQLETAHSTVQQQQQQLQQIQAESQTPATGGGDASMEPTAAAVNQANACINNLRQIDAAKEQWALENNKGANALPTAQDLMPYFTDGIFPVCPSGGTYTINAVGLPPTCSVPGHALPQ